MVRNLCLAAVLVLLVAGLTAAPAPSPVPTTAATPGPTASAVPSPTPGPPDNNLLELETAGYYDLVDWAARLGLPATGGLTDLRQRIAQTLKLTLPPEVAAGGKTLTIDSALKAGLVSVDAPGDGKLLRISGGLRVTLVDNAKKVTHIIRADELWYDQANEEMTARGNVVYTMVRENSKEPDVFRGDSLTFRLSDSEGVFYGGSSERKRQIGTDTLPFKYKGDAIRRSSDDMVVMDDGTITSSVAADPNYRIVAQKIWILAPGEWGLQGAVLYLGRVPVFYFPFFFQPGDDFFFNPVLSFPDAGDRRGTSLQTTTYIWGHKKRDAAPLSFLQLDDTGIDDTGKVQKGLFMVKGTPPKTTVPDTWMLKILADFYSNLGFLTGVDASLPGLWGLKTFTFTGGIGITRTVDQYGDLYTIPLTSIQAAQDPWTLSQWNGSWLGPLRLPFRWGGQYAMAGPWWDLSMQYYSDTLVYDDLMGNRSENFSVFSLLGLGPAAKTISSTPLGSLSWTGDVNVPPVTVKSSLLWDSKTIDPNDTSGNPENNFYLPAELTFPQVSATLSGTLWPLAINAIGPGPKKDGTADLAPPGGSVQPTPTPTPAPGPNAQTSTPDTSDPLAAPARMDPLPLASDAVIPTWTTGATWTLSPTFSTDTHFDMASVNTPQDNGWQVLSSQWNTAYDAKINFQTGWSDNSWTTTDGLDLHQQFQKTIYPTSGISADGTIDYNAADEQATSSLLTQALSSTWKPWVSGGPFRDSNIQYSLSTILWSESPAPGVDTIFLNWDKTSVTTHQTATNGVWYIFEGPQTLKAQTGWQTTLPPLDPLQTYNGQLTYTLPWGTAWTKTAAYWNGTLGLWTFDPWDSYVEWDPWKGFSLSQDYQWSLQSNQPQSATSSLNAWGFTAQYIQAQTIPYTWDQTNLTWDAGTNQSFLPQTLNFSYTLNLPKVYWWYYRNSLSSTVNFTWPINLQQYTNMPISLTYSVSYSLARFLDFTISEQVNNNTAFLYFPGILQKLGLANLKPVNPLADLWDSVSIWDQEALHRTGYKMSSLTLGLTHYLDDWQVSLNYTGNIQQSTDQTSFSWVGTMTLLVKWIPVPELKSQLQVDNSGNLTVIKNQDTTTTP